MGEKDSNLVKKILWTGMKDTLPSGIQSLARCQKLEEGGFGMLANKENPEKVDKSESVVCPDGSILTSKQINDYWDGRYKQNGKIYDSQNPEDLKMHDARMYYLGFKH